MSAPKHHSPAFLALVNAAKSRIQEIDIAGYQRLRAAGKPPKVALVAAMHKLLLILNAMLKTKTVWSPPCPM